MSLSPVLILLVIALAMAVFLPLFDKRNSRISSSWKSRRHRRILLGRWVVAALVIATVITIALPVADLNGLLQGVLISVALSVLAWLVIELIGRRAKSRSSHRAEPEENGQEFVDHYFLDNVDVDAPARSRPIDLSVPTVRRSRQSASPQNPPGSEMDMIPTHELVDEPPLLEDKVTLPENLAEAPELAEDKVKMPADVTEASECSKNEMTLPSDLTEAPNPLEESQESREQLDRVAELVQSHDLVDSELSVESVEVAETSEPAMQSGAGGTDLLLADVPTTDLSTLSTDQIKALVSNLRQDKTRLQKLVIAQQAAIDSERRAHEQSRTVARDAIVIMRDARSSQKLAEKLARRERSERQRLELQYKKVAKALNNAMSIIEQRKAAEQDAGTSDGDRNGKKSAIEDILG